MNDLKCMFIFGGKNSDFLIFRACDACEEWYHGDCINISEKEAKYIKNYFCDRCREEDPSLKTKFRPQKRENDGDSGIIISNYIFLCNLEVK